MFDVTQIILAALGLLVAIISTVLIPYLRQRVSAEKLQKIQMWVQIGVDAAEMIFVGAGRGKEKNTYVTDFVMDKLEELGMTMDIDSVKNMIEAAVLKMKNDMSQ